MHKKLHPSYWYNNFNFWHIDAYENIPSPACLIVFVKSKTEIRTSLSDLLLPMPT